MGWGCRDVECCGAGYQASEVEVGVADYDTGRRKPLPVLSFQSVWGWPGWASDVAAPVLAFEGAGEAFSAKCCRLPGSLASHRSLARSAWSSILIRRSPVAQVFSCTLDTWPRTKP